MLKPAFTIVIMPTRRARVIRIRVPRAVLFAGVAVGAVVALVAIVAIWRGIVLQAQVDAYARLRTADLGLRVQLRKDTDRVQHFQGQMQRLRTLDRKLRLIADLNGKRPAPSMYGIGGFNGASLQAPLADPPGDRAQQPVADRLNALNKDLKRLGKLARYEDTSFNSLQTHLEERHDFIEHTPYRWPLKGFISSGFGPRRDPFTGQPSFHPGIDIVAPKGTIVRAPADGIVTFADHDPTLGNMLVIDHGYGVISRYGHLSAFLVHAGERVKRGDPIGRVGSTGRSTGPHLHYEVRVNDVAINPLKILIK